MANDPIDVATRHTAGFIESNLGPGNRLLEVGCGSGHLAAELMRRGFGVRGLDADAGCVARACAMGVDAIQCEWPDCAIRDGGFDAIAFTRSLHHIEPLPDSIVAARRALRPGGLLLLEDFGYDEIDAAALEWFVDVLQAAAPRLDPAPHGLVASILTPGDPLEAWRRYHMHDHRLHTAAALRGAISAEFSIRCESSAPYLYRYLIPALVPAPDALALVEAVMNAEQRAGATGHFVPVGRRIVAVR